MAEKRAQVRAKERDSEVKVEQQYGSSDEEERIRRNAERYLYQYTQTAQKSTGGVHNEQTQLALTYIAKSSFAYHVVCAVFPCKLMK